MSTATLARNTCMSPAMVSLCKKELESRGLISISRPENNNLSHTITVVDIWKENFEAFATRSHNKVVEKPVHKVNATPLGYESKKEREGKNSAKAGETNSPAGSASGFMHDFADLLDEAMPLSSKERGKLASALQRHLDTGDDPKKLRMAMCRMVARRQEGQRLELADALNDVGGAGRSLLKNGGLTSATPEAAVAYLEAHGDLSRYAYLAKEWDFTQKERPPKQVLARLGGNDEERDRFLTRMRSVARKATQTKGAT